MSQFEDLSNESIEVKLVQDVTECRSCSWFWDVPPYGPYPSFDFSDEFPEAMRERTSRQFKDKEFVRSIEGKSRKQQFVNPQILHGCRKSPVMTIGINPNLTGFWPSTDGARWAYPFFSSYARYAYYYRHRTTHQESFPLAFIKEHVEEEDALIAEDEGWISSAKRRMTERVVDIEVTFKDGTKKEYKQTWTDKKHFVLLYNRSWDGKPQFKKNDIIGGFINIPDDVDVPVEQNVVGYYQRVIPILEQVSAFLRSKGFIPNMEMSEDICQLDMVACASPGWGGSYEIDKREVVGNCVQKEAWVVKQLIQTNPKVIVFSGRSAFQMFSKLFKKFISPALQENMDVYGLLKMTSRDPHYLDIKHEGYSLKARIIISPHFSYDDNFVPHSRLSEDDWKEFQEKYPEAASQLLDEERVSKPNRDDYRGIDIDNLNDFQSNHPIPTIPLLQKYIDPSLVIGKGISQEIQMGNLHYNEKDRHLVRSQGSCRFCVNSHWKFPEGCAYGKDEEEETSKTVLQKVVDYVIAEMF